MTRLVKRVSQTAVRSRLWGHIRSGTGGLVEISNATRVPVSDLKLWLHDADDGPRDIAAAVDHELDCQADTWAKGFIVNGPVEMEKIVDFTDQCGSAV